MWSFDWIKWIVLIYMKRNAFAFLSQWWSLFFSDFVLLDTKLHKQLRTNVLKKWHICFRLMCELCDALTRKNIKLWLVSAILGKSVNMMVCVLTVYLLVALAVSAQSALVCDSWKPLYILAWRSGDVALLTPWSTGTWGPKSIVVSYRFRL